jgi:hypothetical protein
MTSFIHRFHEAVNAIRIFNGLTEEQELLQFVTKLRVGNQMQLKLLRIKAECIEYIFDVIETLQTSQGI